VKDQIQASPLNPSTTLLQDAEEDAGRIGLTIVLAGVVGSVTGGIILDKTHRFKWVLSLYTNCVDYELLLLCKEVIQLQNVKGLTS
jgi:hypothetical protein